MLMLNIIVVRGRDQKDNRISELWNRDNFVYSNLTGCIFYLVSMPGKEKHPTCNKLSCKYGSWPELPSTREG